jgi:hypothetical protein
MPIETSADRESISCVWIPSYIDENTFWATLSALMVGESPEVRFAILLVTLSNFIST